MNTKVMVNWKEKKIVHTTSRVGSEEYENLCKKGYEKVGTVKPVFARHTNGLELDTNPKFFWDDKFFDPKAKYNR